MSITPRARSGGSGGGAACRWRACRRGRGAHAGARGGVRRDERAGGGGGGSSEADGAPHSAQGARGRGVAMGRKAHART
jgi:hypothetical protein